MFKFCGQNFLFFLGFFLLQGVNLAQTPSENPSAAKIHFGDLIDVDVVGSTEYDWRGTITPEGFLSGLDFIEEPVYALCRTEEDVARQIEKGYGKFLREPKVVVRILDRSGRPTSVLYGAVRTPQRFRIERPVRLNELIVLSGGITERASGEIQIFRPEYLSCEAVRNDAETSAANENDKRERFVATRRTGGASYMTIKIADLLAGKNEANPLILAGDIVTVLEASPVYVIGGVVNPRQIPFRPQMTLSRAVASSGGLTKDADEKRVTIFRRSSGETKIFEFDLTEIEAGSAEDPILQPYDIIEVGQKGKAKRKLPPVVKTYENAGSDAQTLPLRIVD
jgi:Periplasmic protein involved in polysaccharide export